MKKKRSLKRGYTAPAGTIAAGIMMALPLSAANVVVPSGYDLIVTQGNGYVNGSFEIGGSNNMASYFPVLALGSGNDFEGFTSGVVIGYNNELLEGLNFTGSVTTLVLGDSNSVHSSNSLVAGSSNEVIENDSFSASHLLVSGSNNSVEDHRYALVSGSFNNLAGPVGGGSLGWNSVALGTSNDIQAGIAWTIGHSNQVEGIASTTLGWGLINPVHSTVMLGTFNAAVTGDALNYADNNPSFVLGNGSSSARSNAIVTLKNGETTLKNKAWDSQDPLVVPATANMSDGRALVVEGHTLLKGQVIIAEPQGDISMGIYE